MSESISIANLYCTEKLYIGRHLHIRGLQRVGEYRVYKYILEGGEVVVYLKDIKHTDRETGRHTNTYCKRRRSMTTCKKK